MRRDKKRVHWKRALPWLLGATSLYYVLARFLPSAPQKHYGVIEDSWAQVLHTAFQQHWQFGRDIVFAFGPWGFLYGGFDPATHSIAIIVWMALALVFWWAGWRVARHFFGNEVMAWLWFMFFIAVSSVTIFLNMDVRLTAFAVLLLLLHFFVEDEPWTWVQVALTIALGLSGLIKFSELLLALVLVLAIAADDILRYRRFPWLLPAYLGSVLLFWVLAGQHLSSLVPFLSSSWDVASGYTEGVMLTGRNEMRATSYFVAAATSLCALIGYVAWRRHRFFGIIPLIGFCLILFGAFKYGYVRNDGHEVTAVSKLLLVSLAGLALLWPTARKKGNWAVIANFLPVLAVWFFAANTFGRYSQTGLTVTFGRTLGSGQLFAPMELLTGRRNLSEAHEKFLDDFRHEFPLPPIKGSVDVYPANQSAVLAHRLDYRPRPMMQSYTAYTPTLAEMNAAFLRGDRAPENILFELWTIDDRFPALDDGLSWPELWTRYEVAGRAHDFVQLQRRTTPGRYELIPLAEVPLGLGTTFNLPSTDNELIWAEIKIDQSLRGKITAFFYKPPLLWINVTLKDGRTRPFRIVPGIARAGFLLSPVVESTRSFALLLAPNSTPMLADFAVASIKLTAETKSGQTQCYQSPIRLRLYKLSISNGALASATSR